VRWFKNWRVGMVKCEICGIECKNILGLATHIAIKHKNSEEYYLKYINLVKGVCKTCGKHTKFIGISKGYKSHCGYVCACNDEDVKKKKEDTNIKIFGCKHPSQNEDIKRKKETTNMKNRGCNHPFQSEEVKDKSKETNMRNRGCEYPSQSEEVKDKRKNTWLKNLGCDHPSKNEYVLKKISLSNKLNFFELQQKYPELILIENLIEGSNGEILGHCKNTNCHNSVENGNRFVVSGNQLYNRYQGINSTSDSNYFYCCEECKKECVLFGKSAKQLDNIFSPEGDLNQASQQDLLTWRNEVLARQLLENKEHNSNYCEICHKTENLQAHHIQPQKLEPGYALDPINGIILCLKCHKKYGHEIGSICSIGNLANKICK
jgi:hypothetical protein